MSPESKKKILSIGILLLACIWLGVISFTSFLFLQVYEADYIFWAITNILLSIYGIRNFIENGLRKIS